VKGRLSRIALALAFLASLGLAGTVGSLAFARARRFARPVATFTSSDERPVPLFLEGGALLTDGHAAFDVATSLGLPGELDIDMDRRLNGDVAWRSDRFLEVRGTGVAIRSIHGGREIARFPAPRAGVEHGCALSPAGDLIALSYLYGLDLRTAEGKRLGTFDVPNGISLDHIRFSSNGDLLCGRGSDAAVYVFSVATRELVARVKEAGPVVALTSEELFSLSESAVKIHSLRTGAFVREIAPGTLSPDASTLLVKSGGAVEVRDVATGAVRRRFPFTARFYALSPGGDRLAVLRDAGRIEVWDVPP
jgi:hypothetical protein